MRKTITSFAFAAVMAMAMGQTSNSTTQTTSQTQAPVVVAAPQSASEIQNFVKANNLSWEDAAATLALARDLNMDPQMILQQRSSIQNVSMYQIAPAFVIQQQTGKNLADVYAMFTGGQTWLQIATSQNVPASFYNANGVSTTGWSNDDFTKAVWQAILMKNYGMTLDDAIYFGNTKNQMNEVVVGQVLSRQDNTPIRDVMSAYTNNQDWGSIDQQFAMNRQNAPNQSQSSNVVAVTTPAQPAPVVVQSVPAPAPVAAAPQPAPDTSAQTTTTTDVAPVADTTETTTTTSHMAVQSESSNPIEEWQIGGGNINPYNGWANVTTTTSSYTLHKNHRKARRWHNKSK